MLVFLLAARHSSCKHGSVLARSVGSLHSHRYAPQSARKNHRKQRITILINKIKTASKPRRLTPYLECGAGYSFAVIQSANGGFYLNTSVGVQWAVCTKMKLLFAVGYELQKLERLKSHSNQYFEAQFKEQLSHNSISIKIGVLF